MTAAKPGSDEMLEHLAEEQAALLRLATLVAEGVSPHEIFSAVSDEVAQLFGSSGLVLRFEEDGLGIVSVGVSGGIDIPVGRRWEFEEGMASLEVYRTGSSARVDAFDWSSGGGPAAETAERVGIVSSVSNPILVQSRLWGAITVLSTSERLADETEDRLERFAQLVATAIANAESRDAVGRTRQALELVAAEQAALRRVATLVAQDAAPAEIFAAVSVEVDQLFQLDVDSSDVAGVVRFDPGPELLVVGVSRTLQAVQLGSKWEPIDLFAPTRVLRTGRSARVDEHDLATVGGGVADFLRSEGYLSQVASPIVVAGRLWGAISVNSAGALPPDSEDRLEKFTELVATAIANAESREAVAGLADEQAALRRVATLVARDAPSTEVFEAVAMEVGKLFDTDITIVGRYDDDGVATSIGNWSASGQGVPVGTRAAIGGRNVLTMVAETGKPARVDGYDDATGEAGEIARRYGWRSSIAAPIVVEDRVWGVMLVATQRPEPFPVGAEGRLAAFTDLVATAVGNAQAHDEVRRFGDTESALRRVATLVAQGVPPAELFSAVASEVERVFSAVEPSLLATVIRFDPGPECVLVGTSRPYELEPIGSRWAPKELYVSTHVLRTGAPARVDEVDLDAIGGPDADVLRLRGFLHQVGSPVVVEGRLWGAITLNTKEALPPDTDQRLLSFTRLVATAIANSESRQALAGLAEEQATLRRIATLVAKEELPDEVFATVAEETGRLLGGVECTLLRIERDGAATNVGTWGETISTVFPLGARFVPDGDGVAATVLRTGHPHRIDDYAAVVDPVARAARDRGIESSVGCPIVVRGEIWGAIVVGTSGAEPFPPETEIRLTQFADLVATAVANAEARGEIVRLADEQAALRRVATLVALGTGAEAVLRAVCDEARALLSADMAGILRFHNDRTVTVMADSGGLGPHQVGTRIPFDPGFVVDRVHEAHQAARFDTDDPAGVQMPEVVRMLGVRSAVASPIVVDGELWGTVVVACLDHPLPTGLERRLAEFTELVATAIANAESKSALNASRRRIVAASDETRRRIERDLHDGTQQRLVSLGLALRAAEANLPPKRDDLRAQLAGVATGLVAAVEDLQEITRGIHPAILSRGGLGPALQTLAHRSAIPVDLVVTTDVRLAEPIEVAAYFVASEALANAAKHSQASRIDLSLEQRDGTLLLSIGDDGVGGADVSRGSGLIGLTDRVEALGGSIHVDSRPGEGTQITAELPVELELPQPAG